MKISITDICLAKSLSSIIPPKTPSRHTILVQEFIELRTQSPSDLLVDITLPKSTMDNFEPVLHLLVLVEILDKECSIKTDNCSYEGLCGVYFPKTSVCDDCLTPQGVNKKLDLKYEQKTIFRLDGVKRGLVVHGYCKSCRKSYWPSFVESESKTKMTRAYLYNDKIFGITRSTFFSVDLLQNQWDHISLANSTFIGLESVYNNGLPEGSSVLISRNLLQDNLLLFKTLDTLKELNYPFPLEPWEVIRDTQRHIYAEAWCKKYFPIFKEEVNSHALAHVCHADPGCELKWVVIDGNEKLNRPECKAEGDKELYGDDLPFVYLRSKCHDFPNMSTMSGLCKAHEKDTSAPPTSYPEDQYSRPATRAFAAQLPATETIITGIGCKEEDMITHYNDRTAGQLLAIRPCGMILNNAEMYTHESSSQVLVFLYDTFSDSLQKIMEGKMKPSDSPFKGLVYDRACDMPAFLRNLAKLGNLIAQLLLILLSFLVDTFHAKGHVKPACTLSSPLCEFHPQLPKFRHLFQPGKKMNTEICEQSFRKLNKTKFVTKYMTPWRRMTFFKLLDFTANMRLEKKLAKKGLLGESIKEESVHTALTTIKTVDEYEDSRDSDFNDLTSSSITSLETGTGSLCSDVNLSDLSVSSIESIPFMEVSDDEDEYQILSGESCEDSWEYFEGDQSVECMEELLNQQMEISVASVVEEEEEGVLDLRMNSADPATTKMQDDKEYTLPDHELTDMGYATCKD